MVVRGVVTGYPFEQHLVASGGVRADAPEGPSVDPIPDDEVLRELS